jgi:predicted transcriptional regulator of viral defense system
MKKRIREIFRKHNGQLRMSEAIKHGISRYMLYSLRDKGLIEQVARGKYRLKELSPITNPDLVTVGLCYPKAVVCLISALAYHEITTQIPHGVSVAVPMGTRSPSLSYPPLHIYRFSKAAHEAGVEMHLTDGVRVKIYSIEKTLADCFKFRNKIGMDVVLEALKLYKVQKKFNLSDLIKYAKVCRVENVIRPYLEAMV